MPASALLLALALRGVNLETEVHLSGVERHFSPDDVIVSKTDIKGRITYANRVFLNIAGLD
jgi:hypothetical protein